MPLLVKKKILGSPYDVGDVLDDDTQFFNLDAMLDIGWVAKVTERELERIPHNAPQKTAEQQEETAVVEKQATEETEDMQSVQPTHTTEEREESPNRPVQPSHAVERPIQPTTESPESKTAQETKTTRGSRHTTKTTKGV